MFAGLLMKNGVGIQDLILPEIQDLTPDDAYLYFPRSKYSFFG